MNMIYTILIAATLTAQVPAKPGRCYCEDIDRLRETLKTRQAASEKQRDEYLARVKRFLDELSAGPKPEALPDLMRRAQEAGRILAHDAEARKQWQGMVKDLDEIEDCHNKRYGRGVRHKPVLPMAPLPRPASEMPLAPRTAPSSPPAIDEEVPLPPMPKS